MSGSIFPVILFYKYVTISDPQSFATGQRTLCSSLGLKGRILIAVEGINGTLAGPSASIDRYVSALKADARFADIAFKASAGDPYASILGFGNDGIVVGPQAFAPGASAASSYVMPFAAGNNSGWDQKVDIRSFTDQNGKIIDLNGDGIADFVGMGPQGLVFALGNHSGPGGGFGLGALQTAHVGAGGTANLGEVQGWNNAATLRDIVYDPLTGYDDIIAFGAAGVYVSMGQNPATHGGEPFGQLYLAMGDSGSNQGWSAATMPRLVGDVTGDGTPDIVGFGANSTFVAVGARDGGDNLSFKVDPTLTIGDFGSAEGWSGSNLQTLRALGTFPSTGGGSHSDLVLSGAFNTQVWQYT
jgi:hypothetical protein